MGLGFRVGSGVRVYGGGRGMGVSVGKGPVRYYHRLGGGSRARRGPTKTSIAAHQRQLRQAQRLEEVQAVLALDKQLIALCRVHYESVPAAERPLAPAPAEVDEVEVRRRLEGEALSGIGHLRLGDRRRAKHAARERVAAEVEAETRRRADDHQAQQADLDVRWAELEANDPEAVLATLEAAFADNEAPAAAVSCREARVDVVMRWPDVAEVVPERKAATTPSGSPTIHKRTKTETAELYLEAMSSNAVATAKEAYAVCPGLDEVGLAVVRARSDPARGDEILEPLLLGTVRRQQFEGVRWEKTMATAALLEAATGKIGMKGKGANKTLFGLELDEDERSFFVTVAEGLGSRVPDAGVAGIALPVRVLTQA